MGEPDKDKLVSLCEPRMRTCRFRQAPFETVKEPSDLPRATVYAGAWPVGELPIKPAPRYAGP